MRVLTGEFESKLSEWIFFRKEFDLNEGSCQDTIVTDKDWLAPLSLTALALKTTHEQLTAGL